MDYTEKTYLGDGLYVWDDGYHICLGATNGLEWTNTVYLDDQVLDALKRYLKKGEENEKQNKRNVTRHA